MNPVQLVTVVLAVLAVIIDPTTTGISDSAQALRYTCPKKSDGKIRPMRAAEIDKKRKHMIR